MDAKKPETKDVGGLTLQEAGLRRLKTRVGRLARLVELNAPSQILANEVDLVTRAMMIAYPMEMAKAIAHQEHTRLKIALGYCRFDECPNPAQVDEEFCPEHLAELERFDTEDSDLN